MYGCVKIVFSAILVDEINFSTSFLLQDSLKYSKISF